MTPLEAFIGAMAAAMLLFVLTAAARDVWRSWRLRRQTRIVERFDPPVEMQTSLGRYLVSGVQANGIVVGCPLPDPTPGQRKTWGMDS